MSNEEKELPNTEEEAVNEEEQEAEDPEPKVYDCPCHYCGDDSIIPATMGCLAPNFHVKCMMPSGQFNDRELSDYRGKWLVIFSIPSRSSVINASEIVAFSENCHRFKDIDCELLGITPESEFVVNAWCSTKKEEGGIGYLHLPIGADLNHCIHRRYGMLDSENTNFYRSTFLIDPEGIVKHISISDPRVGRSVEEILRLVKAFQFVSEHGEQCPAMWKEGDPAIKPNPTESKEYFDQKYE
ncbi:Peroxiredoxin-1 [Tritrichomonas foetus]|uniref:Peroxiredoxin-1 n=1 Tax=Tritrichomonas foetus TaxID=1144522 RepID=A0A1J4KQJ4_9EUKA|nr:Peroxiredoxin-1 [Tritrichomonas foetus]|eukprot:OHT11709.1 Peroxiredoxin-1 [Tritrichomonas foetus]